MEGIPQAELGTANERLVLPEINGPPNGPGALRVSTTRQGVTGIKLNPDGAETVMLPLVPVIDVAEGSLTLSVWIPELANTALNVPVPLVNIVSAGIVAYRSLLVKLTRST